MKKSSSLVIPKEVLSLVLTAFNNGSPIVKKTGKSSFIDPLCHSITDFIRAHKDELPIIFSEYYNRDLKSLLLRAFNFKSPNGATKSFRNLLCFYLSNGKNNWNEIITNNFPNYYNLLDPPTDINVNQLIAGSIKEKLGNLKKLEESIQDSFVSRRDNESDLKWPYSDESMIKIYQNQTIYSIGKVDSKEIDSMSYVKIFRILSEYKINPNLIEKSEVAFHLCFDRQSDDKMSQINQLLKPELKGYYNSQIFLVKISNWNKLLIDNLRFSHKSILETRTKYWTYLVLFENSSSNDF